MSGTRAQAGFTHIRRIERLLRHRGPSVARMLGFLIFGLTGPLRATPAGEPAALRFGFSSQIFFAVNENDARAALKNWAQSVGRDLGVSFDPAMEIFAGTEAIKDALLHGKVDALTMTTVEYWGLRGAVALGPFIFGRTHGKITEEYLLLVHRDNPAARLADLRGRSVAVLGGARASLAAVWLETLLLEDTLGPAGNFWGKTVQSGKLARVVLPVFFRQIDACIVTREGFRTMSELNPQVGRQLKVLAHSAALVPTVFCFRADLLSPFRDNLIAGIGRFADSPAGRQTLTLFQSDHLEVRPVAELDAACALLDRHQRLLAEAGTATHAAGAARPDVEERSR